MSQQSDQKVNTFEKEWFDLAKVIVDRIARDPDITAMRETYKTAGRLDLEQRSQFIAIANRIKAEIIQSTYGSEDSETFQEFRARWRDWYDHKGVVSNGQTGRRLTNEEHIIYSSTPDAEEFLKNMEKK